MRYLYIEKKQRVPTQNKHPKRALRLMQEMDDLGISYDFAHNDKITIDFRDGETSIKINGTPITEYTHIIFGGHHTRKDYEIKKLIVDYTEQYSIQNPTQPIKVQNSRFMQKMDYYSKLGMTKLCVEHGLPTLHTYFDTAGNYTTEDNPMPYPLITKHFVGRNDIVEVDGKRKVKKTVFKVDSTDDWDQDRLRDKNLKNYFIQEFTDVGEDLRIFVSNGKVIGGWKRVAGDSFITVNQRLGSRYIYYNDPEHEIVDVCEAASKAWGVDFMALDFIYKDGQPMILEFSMHPGFSAYETKCEDGEPVNIAKAILESFPEGV